MHMIMSIHTFGRDFGRFDPKNGKQDQ